MWINFSSAFLPSNPGVWVYFFKVRWVPIINYDHVIILENSPAQYSWVKYRPKAYKVFTIKWETIKWHCPLKLTKEVIKRIYGQAICRQRAPARPWEHSTLRLPFWPSLDAATPASEDSSSHAMRKLNCPPTGDYGKLKHQLPVVFFKKSERKQCYDINQLHTIYTFQNN